MNNYTAFIEITNTCDKKCKHCFNAAFNNIHRTEILVSDFESLILELKKNKINRIKIVGGEPTMHSKFEQIIKCLDNFGIPYDIFTDHSNICKYIETFKQCRFLEYIRISVDGNEKIHDYIRSAGSYRELIETMQIVKSYGVPVKLNYTINKLNYGCIKEVFDMARQVGIPISFSAMKTCRNEFCDELMLNGNEMDSFIVDLISEKSLPYEIVSNILKDIADDECFIRSQKSNDDSKHIGCLAGQNNCVVDVFGNVWPCSLLKGETQFNYGNAFEQNLKGILETMRFEWGKLRRDFDDCDKCKYSMNCTGGCRSNAYFAGGITGKDPYCYLYSNIYYELNNMKNANNDHKE